MKNLFFLIIITLLISCKAKTEQNSASVDSIVKATPTTEKTTDEAITFGFSNETGTQVLAFEENTDPKICTQIIDNEGKIAPISFLKTQKGNEKGVNLVSENITNCTGQLFEIKGKSKVNPDNAAVIFNDAFAKNHEPVLLKTLETPQNIDDKTKTTIANDRKRAIKNAWKIADLGQNQSAFIVVFEQKQDSVLASLVIGNQGFIYRDYPAIYDEGSTWRVDDGGEFPNDAIQILAVFRNKAGELEIITEWAGAEGANIEYAKANKNKFETVKEASRYWGAL